MSVAELGLKIDSGPARAAAVDLDALVPAAQRAETATDRLGAAATTMATRVKQAADTVTAMQQRINAATGVALAGGGPSRADDIAAYGKSLDDLRAKYNPVFSAQRDFEKTASEINQAVKVGAITQDEATAALGRARSALNSTGSAHAGLSTQAMAASHSMRGFTEMVIQGVPVQRALAMEANNLTYAMSHPGGLLGAMKEGISVFAGLLNPLVLVGAAIVGTAGAAILAAKQWSDAQAQLGIALSGTGRAAGLMQSGINKIAADSASAFGLSISEAREFASALAATGKIGSDSIAPLTKMGHDLAVVYGGDVTKTAELLARAFSDPAKGADTLNERLGFLDGATRRNIQNLTEQNRLYEAQAILVGKLGGSLNEMRTQLQSSASFWTAIGNGVSNIWDRLGAFLSRTTGIGYTAGLDEQLKAAADKIADLQKRIDTLKANPIIELRPGLQATELNTLTKSLDDAKQKWTELKEKSDEYWRSVTEAQERQKSLAVATAINSQLPQISELDHLKNQLDLLATAMGNVQMTGGAASPLLKMLGLTFEQLAKAIDEAKGKVDGFKSSSERAIAGIQIQIDAVGKRSPAALGNTAYQQTLNNLGSTSADSVRQAELARTLAIKQAQQQITDTQREQLLTAQQRVDTARLELSIASAASVEQERQRAILQAKQQLEQEALQTYGNRDAYDRKHLTALTEQINAEARVKQTLAEQNALRDAAFVRQQIGRTSDEQQVATTLRGIYGDNYQQYMNGNIAAQIRFNQQLQYGHDIFVGFGQEIEQGLQQGKSLWDSFGNAAHNALNKIESKLLDMALNHVWEAAFPSRGVGGGGFNIFSSLFSAFTGGGGGVSTGNIGGTAGVLSAIHHTGYGPGDPMTFERLVNAGAFRNAQRFHTGIGPGERAAIIRDDESVLTPGQMRALAPANSTPGPVTVNVINAPAGTSATAKTTRTNNGGIQIDVALKQVLLDDIASQGPLARGLETTYPALNRAQSAY